MAQSIAERLLMVVNPHSLGAFLYRAADAVFAVPADRLALVDERELLTGLPSKHLTRAMKEAIITKLIEVQCDHPSDSAKALGDATLIAFYHQANRDAH